MKHARFFFVLVFFQALCSAQCPDRGMLWKRIIYLRDSSNLPGSDQLKELLLYLNNKQCSVNNDSTQALLLQRCGAIYNSQSNFYNAVQLTLKSINIVNLYKASPLISERYNIKSYWNLHIFYDSLKLINKKNEALDSCTSISVRLNNGYEYAEQAFYKTVEHHFETGDFFRCISYADAGINFIRNSKFLSSRTSSYVFSCFTNKLNSLISIKKYFEAESLLLPAIKKAENDHALDELGTLYGLYAKSLSNTNHYNESILFYKKSFYHFQKIRYNTGCSESLNNMGLVYADKLNQIATAITCYKKALPYADAEESLSSYANLANLYVKTGKFDSAFYFFNKAFYQAQPGFSEADLLKDNQQQYNVNITEYLSALVLDKADAYLRQYKSTGSKQSQLSAIKIYKTADLYFDKIKNEQSEIQSKLFWKTNNRRLYEHALEACLALGNNEDAFYFFEKSRSVLLGDQVNEQRGLSDDELTKQAQLKKSIATLERTIMDTSVTAVEVEAIKQELFTQKQQLEKIKGSSILVNSYFSNTAVPTISQVQQQLLAGNKTLVELFYGDSAVYIMSLSNSSSYFAKIDKKLYDSLTASYIAFIADPELLNKNFTRFAAVSNGLFKLIFSNTKLPATGSIIISPDGKNFPFEALVTNQNFQSPIYLLMNFATSYTYSARYLLGLQNESKAGEASLMGMAPVVFKSGPHLPALNGSDVSLEHISDYFTTKASFIFDSATSNNFSRQFAGYSILQLYAHAAENSNGSDPVIYFADGPFYLSDLVAERQPVTRLVVLSACETAKGKFYGGEGVFSFNRGFAALGIPAAISNLWSSDDESSYRLTELFYKFLSKGVPADVALQQAKIEFINTSEMEDKKLPYFWAGTILTGRAETFTMHNSSVYYWLAGISAILVIIVIVVLAKKQFRGKITSGIKKPDPY